MKGADGEGLGDCVGAGDGGTVGGSIVTDVGAGVVGGTVGDGEGAGDGGNVATGVGCVVGRIVVGRIVCLITVNGNLSLVVEQLSWIVTISS